MDFGHAREVESATSTDGRRVYPIRDELVQAQQATGAQLHEPSPDSAIIIDHGSGEFRAGWSTDDVPRVRCDNVVSRYRDRKSNKLILLAGVDAYFDATSRSNAKSPYEGDTLLNYDVMENMLDYAFARLDIRSETLQHPVVMTEPLANAGFPRAVASELLFECYHAPAVTYGIDSLFAFYQNGHRDGLVVSSSNATSHVIPVFDGQATLSSAKKLAWGSAPAGEFMLKLMQLKYPTFPGRLSLQQAHMVYQDHCRFSDDYTREIRALADARALADMDRVVQYPFQHLLSEEKTDEELARQAEKKKEAGRRLQEQTQRQRLEKLVRFEQEIVEYTALKQERAALKKHDFERKLKAAGFATVEELDEYLVKIERSLRRARNKELGIDENEGKEEPTFPLVDVPDHQLSETDLKEKRRQRLLKASYDARMRAKTEREQEKRREEDERRADDELRLQNPEGWVARLREDHEATMERIKDRKRRKEELGNRKSAAAQSRMKNIANLAAEGRATKKRRRGDKDDDGFGKNDEDWAVYREIGNADDSEDEEDDQDRLVTIEAKLLEHDPRFTADDTAERLAFKKHELVNAFMRGLRPDAASDAYDAKSMEHNCQLHVNVEQIRVPEVLFQPHIAGVDQAGLSELVEHVIKSFDAPHRERLTSNIFYTGGNTLVSNFDARLRSSIRPSMPVDTLLVVRRAASLLDAWRGAAKWMTSAPDVADVVRREFTTRAMYDECGGEYLREHRFSNWMM